MTHSKKELNFDLPSDYVISKFHELGHKVTYNRSSNTYNGCCPICHEGSAWGRKKRCFYLPDKDVICCHNGDCGWHSKPYNWIREVSQLSYREIWKEIEEGSYGYMDLDTHEAEVAPEVPSLPLDSINLFDETQRNFYKDDKKVKAALEFLEKRRLLTAVNRPDAFYISFKDYIHKNRVTIPFKDEYGKIVFYQTRKIFEWDDLPNYISKKHGEKSICGIDKVTTDINEVFIFEGPIDSFFVQNGVAVGGINEGSWNFTPKQKAQFQSLKFHDEIWVMDSQWVDKTALLKSISLANMGKTVFIWPEILGKKYKDFNEICVSRKLDRISPDFIKKNSCSGKAAILKLEMIRNSVGI